MQHILQKQWNRSGFPENELLVRIVFEKVISMKILHLMLSNFYIDNANYQENAIARQNKIDGHDVRIIASTEVFVKNNTLGLISPRSYVNEDGIPVERIPYTNFYNKFISKKIRAYTDLYGLISHFAPDIIFFHGAAAYALVTVAQYKKNNPHIKFYVDSHEDYHNSGRNFLSRNILHKIFYKKILHKCLPHINKIFYISYESMIYLKERYGISDSYLQFFPLGGFIPDIEMRRNVRKKIRAELGIDEEHILLIHSGKLDSKKKTIETVNAVTRVASQKLRLVIIGSTEEKISASIKSIIESDRRIRYLGWLNSNLLQDYLCAGDLYVQLGTQSATMQNALCCGCAAAVYPYESHKYLLKDSVFYIESMDDLIVLLESISANKSILETKRLESYNLAKTLLDYKILSTLIYNDFSNTK